MTHYPADSTDARELRAQADDIASEHDPKCSGWLDEDPEGRPRPCPTCKPHLAQSLTGRRRGMELKR